ncbi:MAG: shikimate kinase [Bacteroidota bacterium]
MKVFLIGFLGAGKTTIGKYAARHNELSFLDLDMRIEQKTGMEVRDIFKQYGEDHFRELERKTLHEVCDLEGDWLISCGGGTPCFFDNMDYMNARGLTLYLDLSAARLTDRLRNSASKRPLIAHLKGDLQVYVHKKLMQRAPMYAQAQVIVPEGQANKKGVRDLLEEWLRR